MVSQFALAQELLGDDSQATRLFGVRVLADATEPAADMLLARLIVTADARVAEQAVAVLRHRCPWLALEPTPVMALSAAASATRTGQAWAAYCEGLERAIDDCCADMERLRRYVALPGLIPDLIERLLARGHDAAAKAVANAADLHGCGERTAKDGRQVLLAPTYRCNIDCSYCYAKAWDTQYPAELELAKIPALLDWLVAQNVRLLQLAGGEPTVYRHLGALLQEAQRRGMVVWLTSNGLFPKEARELITKDSVALLVAHYDQEHAGAAADLRKRFVRNVSTARDRGVEVVLRYTLTPVSDMPEWELLLDTAAELGVSRVNFGFAFRNFAANNTHSAFTPGMVNPLMEAQFAAFAATCAQRGVRLHQSKPMPLCMLSLDALRPLLLNGSLALSCTAHRGGCTQNITINPDLSTFPCNSLGIEGPRVGADLTLADIGARNAPLIHALHRHPHASACKECFYFYRGFCQGACLVEHYAQLESTVGFRAGKSACA